MKSHEEGCPAKGLHRVLHRHKTLAWLHGILTALRFI